MCMGGSSPAPPPTVTPAAAPPAPEPAPSQPSIGDAASKEAQAKFGSNTSPSMRVNRGGASQDSGVSGAGSSGLKM